MDAAYKSWRQTDSCLNRQEAWSAAQYPDATYHYFKDCGCLVCALAVMLRHYGIETTEDETLFNPWVLNKRLIDCVAFSSAADLDLSRVCRLYPLEYLGAMPYSRDAMDEIVQEGLPCLVTVPGVNASKHFLTICESAQEDVMVYDPLCGESRLSSYNKVLEIRAFRPLI